jgi:hypothetical protein
MTTSSPRTKEAIHMANAYMTGASINANQAPRDE